jgi:hypothetical protein
VIGHGGFPEFLWGFSIIMMMMSNLLSGNPVIAVISLPDGGYHFMVIVGKEGRDYLIRDPAASPFRRA